LNRLNEAPSIITRPSLHKNYLWKIWTRNSEQSKLPRKESWSY